MSCYEPLYIRFAELKRRTAVFGGWMELIVNLRRLYPGKGFVSSWRIPIEVIITKHVIEAAGMTPLYEALLFEDFTSFDDLIR